MAYKIRQAKLDLMIRAYGQGDNITIENAPIILGVKTPNAVKAYMEAFLEWKDNYENGDSEPDEDPEQGELELDIEVEATTEEPTAPKEEKKKIKKAFTAKKKAPTAKDIKDYRFFVEDEDGVEEELEAVTVTSSTVLLRKIEPIWKTLRINGDNKRVDIRELSKMSPDDKYMGVLVSDLLIAAKFA